MEDRKQVIDFKENIKRVVEFEDKELIDRREWGEINFEPYSFTFEKFWNTINHLNTLPVEYLSDSDLQKASSKLDEIIKSLQQIDKFALAGNSNPQNQRDSLGNDLKNKVDQFHTIIAIWIPFLAYQKGDVSENILKLNQAISKADEEMHKAQEAANKKLQEIEKISTKAREAAATAGAAVFTNEFSNEASEQLDEAKTWLWATGILAAITAILAIIGLILSFTDYVTENVWQFVSAKITLFILLFTATVWAGKIYRALKHQAAINKHRSLGLKTFQAFSNAASDSQTKNAVLLETTRSIFSGTLTGFVDSKQSGNESDIRIIEMLNSVTKTDSN
jgi:hypothetical protein